MTVNAALIWQQMKLENRGTFTAMVASAAANGPDALSKKIQKRNTSDICWKKKEIKQGKITKMKSCWAPGVHSSTT